MEITLRFFDGCPNWQIAAARLREAIEKIGIEGNVSYEKVRTPEDAERLGFTGSPTILIEGNDPFAQHGVSSSLSCRIYQTPDGPQGSPTTDQLIRVLRGDSEK